MNRRLRPPRSAWILSTLLLVTGGGIGQASTLALGILEADSTGSCVLFHQRSSETRFVVSDPGGFSVGDTVVARYGRIDTVSCGPSGRYPHFLWAALSSRQNYHGDCGDVLTREGCAIYNDWDLNLQTIHLVGCETADLLGYAVSGELMWECDPSSPCDADFCLANCRVEWCPDPAVEETTWGKVKLHYRPEPPGQ